ncbi:TIGR03086 family metal-binding protein [Actinomadura macrotermitis]|uniref:Mycothiol-dependent maleylpyruvate isomerase metal-binding domain-containing protein n=1 Tax=Actinomadura macrotermitis TaxID=2585200 RepID=A0A7K0C090_9ACTN|nr:TIGR03086 family metal-binding protein [Actinomadura macrotermitis]MQY06875.1 hypothetical protein [Actinomadura macrotermitis]
MSENTAWPVLAEAHEALRTVARGVSADDLARPTPCAQWTVAQVLQHAAGDQIAYAAFLGEGSMPAEDPFAPSGTLAGSPADMIDEAVAAASRAWAKVAADAAEVPVPMPPNTMSAVVGSGACALDAAVHAWDVAVATGQPSPLTAGLARELLPVARQVVIQPLRDYGAFGPVIEGGDDDVTVLLHFLGRRADRA